MRDKLKSEQYFRRVYQHYNSEFISRQNEYLEKIAQNNFGTWKPKTQSMLVAITYQRAFYSGYSLGLSKNEIGKDLIIFRDTVLRCGTADEIPYNWLYFLFSAFIIYGFSKEYVEPVIEFLTKEKYKDFVLDTMANFLKPSFEIRTEKLKFNKALNTVADAIKIAKVDKEMATKKLKHYLDRQWLKLQKEGIIDNQDHLKDDAKFMVYLGYWSIESAALVIMLGLDDTSLKDCKYYPYDLVHG